MKSDAPEPEPSHDVESFMAQMTLAAEERNRLADLIQCFKQAMPAISAHWDTSEGSFQHNDIAEEVVGSGLAIYMCGMEDLWEGIYEPAVYDAGTLWSDDHDSHKIAKVINAWLKGQKLSPLFLVKYGGDLDLGLVSDGKHRLTVARAIRADVVPFMVGLNEVEWVSKAIPAARRLNLKCPGPVDKS